MLKLLLVIPLTISLCMACFSQTGRRYKDYVFSAVSIKKNIVYTDVIPEGSKKKRYLLDLYEPTEDSSNNRPIIIWMHGGGFKFGSKKQKNIRIWSRNFAKRGYVCAAINYRLSKNNPLKNFNALVKGCYDAVQDLSQAIEFLKNKSTEYQIDTSTIILAGNSAGGIIALQAVYSRNSELSSLAKGLDSTLVAPRRPVNITAIINFWGGIFDTTWLQNAFVPIVSVHGRKDRVVAYKYNGSSLYGSYAIHDKAGSLGIPNRLKTYERFGHELQKHFIPILRSRATKNRWIQAEIFSADFLYDEVFNKR